MSGDDSSSAPRERRPKAMSAEERAARMDRVWEKHLDGKTITLDEFVARRRGRQCASYTSADCSPARSAPGGPMLRIGRLELYWRSGSWCRPDEWCWGRQGCDVGCFVLDCGFFVVTWYVGEHADGDHWIVLESDD